MPFFRHRSHAAPALEESLEYGWVAHHETRELPVPTRSFLLLAIGVVLGVGLIAGRIVYLAVAQQTSLTHQATANVERPAYIAAPRGIIRDRYGVPIAENAPAFTVLLDVRTFIEHPDTNEATLALLERTVGLTRAAVYDAVRAHTAAGRTEPLALYQGLAEAQVVAIKAAALPTLSLREGFQRRYDDGPAFASVLGYTNLVNARDLAAHPTLLSDESIGRVGIEAQYDEQLRGIPGKTVDLRDARGRSLGQPQQVQPILGNDLQLTIDADLQRYFYQRLSDGLRSLGRTAGAGIALDPRTGEVLALISMPSYDPNVFVATGRSDERRALITDTTRPLYNRVVSGEFAPGSTIKPLVATAVLTEHVVDPTWSIFSPGYLDIPNPYHPEKPTRFVDWRYQGVVNVYSAIAQSSNVYFYAVGGGTGGLKGLGIARLHDWWERFLLGQPTGIDLPGERSGFLPSPAWKEEISGKPWLLGDTYNVSIGQGDLKLTPIQLAAYVVSLANGGTIYRPYLSKTLTPQARTVLADAAPAIREAQKGMRLTVTSKLGTAHQLDDLPLTVAGKTGSAQIANNTKENAFFVGYAPYEDPQIVVIILVEDAKHGSLNAVPIAKDVFRWYYDHRLAGASTR